MPLSQEEVLEQYKLLGVEPGSKVAVAVSGGADSLGLLLLTAPLFDVTAITVDHGLRAEAEGETAFVAGICRERDINHIILRWQGDKPSSNIQAAARAARYHLMQEWCEANGVRFLAVAHHRDDQAETLLLRLARGSGVYGLAAMPAVRNIGGDVSIVRPLLDYAKSDIEETLRTSGQTWVDDPSNVSEAFDRVRVRKFLASPPLDGMNSKRLAATAERLRRSRDALQYYEQQWLAKAVSVADEGFVILDRRQLSSEPEEIILRGLASLCRFFSGAAYVPRMEKLLRLRDALISGEFRGHTLYGAQFSVLDATYLLISREASAAQGEIPLEKSVIWDNRFAIDVRGDISGLKIAALGADGWSKMKAILPDFGQVEVPRLAGLVLPCIFKDAELRAVPHLGYNTLEDVEFKVSLKTDILTKK